jgi:hypothetical protein
MKKMIAIAMAIGLLSFLALGCNGGEEAGTKSEAETYHPVIDPADFTSTIDNPYFLLTPGATYIFEGDAGDGFEHIEMTVSNETKEIVGVECVVVEDTVTIDGEVAEVTLDWYAQDKDGNVWYFGEDSKEYENGKVKSTQGSWEAGVDGAEPGIIMKVRPSVGEEYRQEYYAGEAEDMVKVESLSESVSVTTGSYSDCLKTYEWTPLEPDLKEYKYYALGIGIVLETQVEDESLRIELIDIKTS